MYSIKASVLIGLLLAIPFFLRYKGFEPYPAVLLPDGAVMGTSVHYTLVYGRTANGQWQELPAAQLFQPVPVQYSSHLIKTIGNSYQEEEMSSRSILLRKLGVGNRFQPTSLAKAQANNWVKHQLSTMKLDTTVIKLAVYKQVLTADEAGVRKKTLENEQIVELGK